MKVYRISKCEYIEDLEGTGAARYPGRWNSKGVYILYTAATPSLALLGKRGAYLQYRHQLLLHDLPGSTGR